MMPNPKTNLPHNIIFVTGTDTGVGKTFVGCAVAKAISSSGRTIAAVKPVESGCTLENPNDEDGRKLASATGQIHPKEAFDRLTAPLAPPVAAEREGRTLSSDVWCERIVQLAKTHEVVMVEGAGGLLSPLTWEETNLDLVIKLNAQVLIVAPNRLGVVNQALMVLRVLAYAEVPVIGVVLSVPTPTPDDAVIDNPSLLKRFSNLERIHCLPYIEDRHPGIFLFEPIARWCTT